jgi:hypothetical protein
MEKALVYVWTTKLLDGDLVELSKNDYVLVIMMFAKNDIFGNWTEWCRCGDYRPINKRTCLNKYAMPLLEEIFDALGQTKVFSTLNLRFGYHQLPLKESDKVKMGFWGTDLHGKDCLYQWQILPINLKNALVELQRVMDQMLGGIIFAKCYIDDIIVFSSTSKYHVHHLQEVFETLKDHNLKLHPSKC